MTEPASVPLAPIYESILGDDELDALFNDLGMLDVGVDISVKSAPTERATEGGYTLAAVRQALRDRTVRGVQLRYVHEGTAWCDTLFLLSSAVRLVRSAVPTLERPNADPSQAESRAS